MSARGQGQARCHSTETPTGEFHGQGHQERARLPDGSGTGWRQHGSGHHRLLPLLPRRRGHHVGLRPASHPYGRHRGRHLRREPPAARGTTATRPSPCRARTPCGASATHPSPSSSGPTSSARYCSRVEPTLQQVKDTYGPDKVRLVWKNNPLPFHQNAKPAAEAAQGAFALGGNDAFWKWHDTAFKNQQSLGTDSYVKWAQDAGVKDTAAYKAGLDSHKWADKVDKDLNDGKAAGVQGTPAFFVNGVFINGAQPFDNYKKTIDQELQKAQAKIAAGTPKSRIYAEMTKENKKNAPAAAKNDEEQRRKTRRRCSSVPVDNSPVLGSPNALVTIVEFSDFQCPFCSRVEPTLKAIRDKYGDKVRIVWKNEPLPFHNRAEPCAEAAMEVRAEKGDKGFWAMHDDAVRQPEGAGGRRPRQVRDRRGRERRQGEGRHHEPHAQEGDRRGQRPGAGLPGAGHAELLHQRTSPRRHAVRGEVRQDHRRGDHQGAGPRSRRAPSRASSTTRSSRTARVPPRPR